MPARKRALPDAWDAPGSPKCVPQLGVGRDCRPVERRWLIWPLSSAVWLVIGLASASAVAAYQHSMYAGKGSGPDYLRIFTVVLLNSFILWLLTPPSFRLALSYPLLPGKLPRRIPLYIGFGLLFAAAHVALRLAMYPVRENLAGPPLPVTWLLARQMYYALVADDVLFNFGAVVAVAHGLMYYRKYRDRELVASQLETRLAQAQLQSLRMQLHPHFLFNTMHTISALMHIDVQAADHMITRLCDLLRLALRNVDVQLAPLKSEIEFLDKYLQIEQARFADRMSTRMKIEPETLEAQVPYLLLQPIVENAVRHGIARLSSGGEIEIGAQRSNGRLRLSIRDNGPGIRADESKGQGYGLEITRDRLEKLYGSEHDFRMESAPGGGMQVSISIPFVVAGESQLRAQGVVQ